MEDTKANKNLAKMSFQVPDELRNRYIGKLKGNGLDVKEAMTRFIEAYMQDNAAAVAITKGHAASAPAVPVQNPTKHSGKPDKNQKWLDILSSILNSGHAVAIDAITRNLFAFDVLVEKDGDGKRTDYQATSPEDLEVMANLNRAADRLLAAKENDRKRAEGADRSAGKRRAS